MKQSLFTLTGLVLVGGLFVYQVQGQSTPPLPTTPPPTPVPVAAQPLAQGLTLGEGEDALVQEVRLSDGSVCVVLVGHTYGTTVCRWAPSGALLPATP